MEKQYRPQDVEPTLMDIWRKQGIYHFVPVEGKPNFSIDTPPPTVSGNLHLGHVFSYTHPDIFARFWRMRGYAVFYPMGYDDNGLPTERLVERRLGIRADEVGREAFIQRCLEISDSSITDYQSLWLRLGLSVDWRYSYRTIDAYSRKLSQLSFIWMANAGRAYQSEAPAIWCPECRTSIAQAELNDLDRPAEYLTVIFRIVDGAEISVATTRPELLPACVAVFIHPEDDRYRHLVGKRATVPLFGQEVPILEDSAADPQKGTGAVMGCTFGDATDVAWWYTYHLPLISVIGPDGKMTAAAGKLQGMTTLHAREWVKRELSQAGLILDRSDTVHSVRVHERCDTPVEYMMINQWFIRILDLKNELNEIGKLISWHPEHMQARYSNWVENLNWDWCISRQRYFGVPFPLWYCTGCGAKMLAQEEQLPVDPLYESPNQPCACGSASFRPETDVMDTWATSSLSPEIAGRWLGNVSQEPELFTQVFPFSLRPQAHEIIRTWAFYTIVKSHFHLQQIPWKDVLISGWGLAGEGMGKISKSRGGGPMAPLEIIQQYSADAVRYWAASTAPGKDALISEEKIQLGSRLVNKLWNVARFASSFIRDHSLGHDGWALIGQGSLPFTLADQWILARLRRLIVQVTALLEEYEYAAAKSEIERFFWQDLADNYLEMCKQRLYGNDEKPREAAILVLNQCLLCTLKLLAPFLPFATEAIYQELFAPNEAKIDVTESEMQQFNSIHSSSWPIANTNPSDEQVEKLGSVLVDIATAVRRYKSERNLPLGTELEQVKLVTVFNTTSADQMSGLISSLAGALPDLQSVTRARHIEITSQLSHGEATINVGDRILLQIVA